MKSWKTTVAGALGAVGVYLSNLAAAPPWLHILGQILSSGALVGLLARDNDKSSEQVGAGPKT